MKTPGPTKIIDVAIKDKLSLKDRTIYILLLLLLIVVISHTS